MTFYTAPLFLLRDCNRHHTTNIYHDDDDDDEKE